MTRKPNVTVVPSLAEPLGKLWCDLQSKYTGKGEFYVAAPLSNSAVPVFDWVVHHKNSFSNWDKVQFVLMDEQVEGEQPPFRYIAHNDPASYELFAHKHFLDRMHEAIPVLKPDVNLIDDFAPRIDLLILALGIQGNYANVMPGTPVDSGWHIAHLSSEFRQTHTTGAGAYAGATFRNYGMSLGPQQVIQAAHVAVAISGPTKADLTKQLLACNEFDPNFPLSIVHHPLVRERVSFYITNDAMKLT
jgi:6-phosphogluconolactonase/glucosamine-6-phosphate isomerase/deaminase